MLTSFICLAIALHDVDGPIYCAGGEKVRLQGIGALEMSGRRRGAQPGVPGDPRAQRRTMARVMRAAIAGEDPALAGRLWFVGPVRLQCERTGRSHDRVTAWCRLPDGRDLSCAAIEAGVALRWAKFDRGGRLRRC